jgi:S1-C subfamily serine protease
MKPNFLKPFVIFISILAAAALACQAASPAVEPITPESPSDTPTNTGDLSSGTRANLISATVQIFGLFNDGGDLVPGYVGSGTILTPTGLILTNAHVASPASQGEPESEPDALGVAIIVSEDKPAVPTYIAEVRAVDGFLDLAVIQITSSVNGAALDPNSLNLPFVQMGNSDNVHVGDDINIFGFPAIGGNTITFTKGTVSGFSSEDQLGDRAWIKTDTTISGGNSGGLAADNNGHIIGVPTIAASSREADTSDCRQVQDTNGDGVIDGNDSCVPIGGFLNGIRPVNLAIPLIQAAQGGKQYTSPYALPGVVSNPGGGSESATGFVWLDTSPSTPQQCDWSNDTLNAYQGEVLCIAAGFEFNGMSDGEALVEYWYLNDQKVAEYSYAWEWGESGLFGTFLPNDGNPMPDGTYRLELFAGDSQTPMGNSPEVTVSGSGGGSGGGQPQQPTSGDTITVYGLIYDAATNNPISGAYVFVLSPGTTYDEWAATNYNESYVEAFLETGANGQYKITGIPRGVEFTLVFAAQGYYDSYADNLIAGPNDPDLNEINVGLSK